METKDNREILMKSHVLHGHEPHCFGQGHLFPITFLKNKVSHFTEISKVFPSYKSK